MSQLTRSIGPALTAAALAFGTIGAAGASPAQHEVFEESYAGSEQLSAADNPCGAWAGTFHEVRSGSYRILTAPGGQVEGEFHVNGAVDGQVELHPDDPALPAYAGSYREKVNAIVTGFDEEEGDLTRVAQFRLRIPLVGSDGSSLVLSLAGKLTRNAAGEVVVSRETMTCS